MAFGRDRVSGIRSALRALRDGPDEEPLAPTARDWRWWIRALRRQPWLVVTGVVAFGAGTALRQVVPVHGFLRALGGGLLFGLVGGFVRGVHALTRQAAEAADIRAERLARRRPVDVSSSEATRPEWSWRAPTARHAFRWSLAWAALAAAVGVPMLLVPDGWNATLGARLGWLAFVALVFVAPLIAAVTLPLAKARRARAMLVGPLRPWSLRLVGVGRASQAWYAVDVDAPDGERFVLPPFPGRSLLVAGDVVHVWAAALPPRGASSRTDRDVPVAVVGPAGTLWARLGYDSVLLVTSPMAADPSADVVEPA